MNIANGCMSYKIYAAILLKISQKSLLKLIGKYAVAVNFTERPVIFKVKGNRLNNGAIII